MVLDSKEHLPTTKSVFQVLLQDDFNLVDFCFQGTTALQLIEQKHIQNVKFKLIFIEWKLKEMSGKELTFKLREFYGNNLI